MSKFYTYAKQWGNNILFRGYKDGKSIIQKIPYRPTLYIRGDNSKVTPDTWKDFNGNVLEPISFDSIRDAKDFIERYDGVYDFPIYGMQNFDYQFLKEEFPGAVDFDFKQVKIFIIDVETSVKFSFPDVYNPLEELTHITVTDMHKDKPVCFCLRDVDMSGENVDFRYYATERELLSKFVDYFEEERPDIISGWFSNNFDYPYIAARIERVLGEDYVKRMSPFGIYRWKDFTFENGKKERTVNFLGVTILDYLDLYKKYSGNKTEENGLGFIASLELGDTKTENPYDTFEEFSNDYKLFTVYNIKDATLVKQMDQKLRLFELALFMTYRAKSNIADVLGTIKIWDCKTHDYLYDRKIAVPNEPPKKANKAIEGAYVKPPLAGRYTWEVSVDAEALYPSIMMGWNISPDTILPTMRDCNVDLALENKVDVSGLIDENVALTLNGAQFTKNKRGFIPAIIEGEIADRKRIKGEMLSLESQYNSEVDKLKKNGLSIETLSDVSEKDRIEAIKAKAEELSIAQKAVKLLLNSLYGSTGQQHFRYFDIRIAEAITLTGQMVTKTCEIAANEIMNQLCGTRGKDYVIMSHTDSLFINMGDIVKKHFSHLPDDKICDIVDKIVKDKITPKINEACANITKYTNAYENRLNLKREKIAKYGIHLEAKNRYAVMVLDNEGVRYATPKLAVTGLEIIRSSTPGKIKKLLKEALNMILVSDEKSVQKYIADQRALFNDIDIKDIAFPKTCNGIAKWTNPNAPYLEAMFKSSCPIQVRAAVIHNKLLEQHNLKSSYSEINEGEKIKFIYLVEPNPLHQDVIGFKGKLPPEFNLHQYIDYDTMWEKTFLKPLEPLLSIVGWRQETVNDLGDLFD